VTEALQGLPPVIDLRTRLVVLGSFPGVASLQAQQYYGHPRNHFWPIVGALWQVDLKTLPYAERVEWLLAHGLGLWDVYATCRREGSLDSAIRDARTNDLASLRQHAPALAAIAHNGGESARWLRVSGALGLPVFKLPSSSPANASCSFDRKVDAWRAAAVGAGLSLPAATSALSSRSEKNQP
jgi:hypoxanthine-DNA glycosylase